MEHVFWQWRAARRVGGRVRGGGVLWRGAGVRCRGVGVLWRGAGVLWRGAGGARVYLFLYRLLNYTYVLKLKNFSDELYILFCLDFFLFPNIVIRITDNF